MAKYLIDTCVWRDFFQNRKSLKGAPLGKFANELFIKIIKNKDRILYSNVLIKELRREYSNKEITDRLGVMLMSGILKKIEPTEKELAEALALSQKRNIPIFDCLNAILARNHKAIMVTQDKHFFNNLSDIVEAVRPQNIK